MTGTGTQTRTTGVTTIALLVLCTGELKMGDTVSLYVNMTFRYQIVADIRQNHMAIKYRSHNPKI